MAQSVESKKAKMKNGSSVEDSLVALIAKIGEKITIGQSKTISNSSSTNYQYLHTVVKDNLAKLAVIVSLETKENSETKPKNDSKTFNKFNTVEVSDNRRPINGVLTEPFRGNMKNI